MWEMIERMATDRLWIYTALAGSVFGAIFVAYVSTTRLGLWFYSKVDRLIDYLVNRWGLTWLQQPTDAWRKRYPHMTKKIDEIDERLKMLEKKSNDNPVLNRVVKGRK